MRQQGFTMLELMATIAIMAILFSIAVPSYQRMQARSEVRSVVNQWQSSYYFAQAEAMRIKGEVRLCPSKDSEKCDDSATFSDGWIVIDDKNTLLRAVQPPNRKGLTMTLSQGKKITITANGRLTGFVGATLTIKTDKPATERKLVINSEGSIRGAK